MAGFCVRCGRNDEFVSDRKPLCRGCYASRRGGGFRASDSGERPFYDRGDYGDRSGGRNERWGGNR